MPNARCGRNIGLHSKKGPTWGQMGRSFIRAALNSARNVHPQDNSPQAAAARRIQGFHELDGIEFLARVDVEKDAKGEDRNVVKLAVEPDPPRLRQAAWACRPRPESAARRLGRSGRKPRRAASADAATHCAATRAGDRQAVPGRSEGGA